MWSKQFLAMSGKKKYKEVLTRKTAIPSATMNESAYHNLILTNPKKVAFNEILKAHLDNMSFYF